MSLKIVGLQSLLDEFDEDYVQNILNKFKSIPTEEINDVEYFLHSKSIHFEKMTISTTHLIFSEYQKEWILVGYFSLANKDLVISKKNFNKLSNNQRKKLCQSGSRTDSGGYTINSYLIGQLGKNYADRAVKANSITGTQILNLAYDTLLQAKKLVNAKYVWLECIDNEKLLNFYKDFGFTEISNYVSENKLKVLIMKLTR